MSRLLSTKLLDKIMLNSVQVCRYTLHFGSHKFLIVVVNFECVTIYYMQKE